MGNQHEVDMKVSALRRAVVNKLRKKLDASKDMAYAPRCDEVFREGREWLDALTEKYA